VIGDFEKRCADRDAREREDQAMFLDEARAAGATPAELAAIENDIRAFMFAQTPERALSAVRELAREAAERRRTGRRASLLRVGVPELHLRHVYDCEPHHTDLLDAAAKYLAERDERPCLVLVGNLGTGKSAAAAKVLVDLHPMKVAWIAAADVGTAAGFDAEAKKQWRGLVDIDALVIDDVGASYRSASDFNNAQIARLFMARYDAARITILTANLEPEELPDVLGPRVYDRLKEVAFVYRATGTSLRGGMQKGAA